MGVPKFFRYISERYPCLSELVKDYQIPEFDNLYLDMNGIIHNCSHPNDDDPHFRITEEKIFQDIFHYIEVLFRMIKPQKLFFMAVDGVAPRAKMNQQRGRRFRSAADATKAEAEALKKGESLPTEARFDSNCITPGTVFMARLQEQLKYFVVDKISNDPLWQRCKVILSGHETPGEGEHKIMDYIRYMRAQPGYNPNTRHCLYGLDADLVMLGLCTHEPHFSLLREEVKFGKKSSKRITVPEEITFFLLHLSLLREYLELEFASIKSSLRGFEYDLEKIIDDWVLMGFLVGNDFIPHLPNLHIAEGALPILYQTYMEVLPTLDGYINEGGKLNLVRFEAFLQKLGEQDMLNFEQVRDDIMYMESKRGKQTRDLEEWNADEEDGTLFESLEPEAPKPQKDSGLAALLKSTDELCLDDETDISDEDEFANFKKDYYKEKLEYLEVTPEVLRDQAEGFVRAIQWNLNYYYNGCCSWSWFYPHHYSPYISDIKGFKDLNIEFDMGKPFQPYEQLLAVLPAASKQLLPECYHPLMTDENSLIIDYYPEKFECDLNGKKQAWEAVVKIPFIDEKLLLEAMSYHNDNLTTEEKRRNTHGPMSIFTYTPRNNGPYPAPCYFPDIPKNHTELKTMNYSDVLVPRDKLIKGAYPGAHMNTYYPGFPTMKHLKYRGELRKAHVRVFEQPSRNESMIVTIIKEAKLSGDMIPVDLLGTSVFIGWPHLKEAQVVAISNSKRKFICMGGPNQYNAVDLKESDIKEFNMSINGVSEHHKSRMGIDLGETKVLVYVKELIGRKFTINSQGKLTFEKQFAQNTSTYPLQAVVFNITAHDPHNNVVKDIEAVFPKNSVCFTLTNPYYGSQGVVQDSALVDKPPRIKISISVLEEPDLSVIREMHDNAFRKYKPAHQVASPLCISNVLFSRITGSIHVKIGYGNEAKKVNIGLDLKLNKKNKETPGYTKKVNNYWFYTERAADLVREYIDKFPEVFEYISRNSDNDDMSFERLFPMNGEQRLEELKQWLKSLPTESVEKQPCNSIGLEPETVLELEKIIDSFNSVNVKKVTMKVKPNLLYRPEVQTGTLEPDPKTITEILDRIVNVRHGYTVPFGYKGTVTAIRSSATKTDRDTMYEVVFDKPFRDGLNLNCSDNRGYMLPKTAFINISYGQRLMVEKTGKPDELIAKAEAANSSYFNNLVRPQPSFQQQWFPPQQPSLLKHQNHPPINQTTSAFVHFSNSQRKPASEDNGKSSVNEFINNHLRKDDNLQQESTSGNENKEGKNALEEFFKNVLQRELHKETSLNAPDAAEQKKPTEASKKDENERRLPKGQGNNGKNPDREKRPDRPENWRDQSKTDNHQDRTKNPNNFMPNFKKQTNGAANIEGTESRNDPNASKTSRATVDTDFLKNMLGIGKSPNKTRENKENVVSNVKNDTKSSNFSFDMLAQVANTPASVRLLTYYQSNQLGLPRYQYFPDENKMIRAQITLSDGNIMVGAPARTREDASEKVAAIVLDVLLKKGNSLDTIHKESNIPAPPVNWVQPDSKKKCDKSAPSQNQNKPKPNSAVLHNSFVPLQAVKSHISKASGSTKCNDSKESAHRTKKDQTAGKDEKPEQSKQNQKSTTEARNRPKRERKTRIAANFLIKN